MKMQPFLTDLSVVRLKESFHEEKNEKNIYLWAPNFALINSSFFNNPVCSITAV